MTTREKNQGLECATKSIKMSEKDSKSDTEPRKGCDIDQDPDYREAAPPDRKKLKLMEDTGKFCFGEKVKQILTKCFDQELERQEDEIKQIDEAIYSVQQKLHVLRNVVLQSFFSGKRNSSLVPSDPPSEPIIHPTVKQVIGKRPPSTSIQPETTENGSKETSQEPQSSDIKIPRYVPPKLPEFIAAVPVRGEHRCSRKKLYIGNISKWIPVSERTDNSSHKWMVYVRGPKENPDVSSFVKKVVFYLHPSYAPHDVVQVSSYPFHVTRRGWGEFPLRVQLFFSDPLSKPVNVIHNLKLDRTYTGLQTLGSETVVDVFVNENLLNGESKDDESDDLLHRLEQANEDMDVSLKETSFEESDLLKDLSTIKTEKEDVVDDETAEMDVQEEIELTTKETQAPEIALRDLATIKIEKEEILEETKKEEVLPIIQPNIVKVENVAKETPKTPVGALKAHPGGASPKVVPIKSLQLNAGARLLAPGTVGFPSRIVAPSLIRPMIVRCVNKEGVPIRLPLNLLRNAVVIRPSRVIRPGESLLRPPKPGESLLRAPLLRASVPLSSILKLNTKPEAPPPKPEVVKTDEEDFEESLLSAEWLSTRDCVRRIVQHVKIIDSRASDASFRSRHPFTCSSHETFSSWNIGKQRSCEWMRAKAVHELLSKCKIKEKDLWSVKTILRWCRHHGYSPMTANPIKAKPSATTTFPSTVSVCQVKEDPVESDCVVDVENVPSTNQHHTPRKANEVVTLNSEDPDLTLWITQQLKKFGYQLSPELCDTSLVNFTSIMFTQLWKSLADDLLRRSLREAWARQNGANPDEITLSDAFQAVVHRPEFDLFTSAGLSLPNDTSRSVN